MDSGLDWTRLWTELDWTGLFFRGVIFFGGGVGAVVLFFLFRKKWRFQPFPQQAIFFHLGRGGGGGGRGVVLYRL